MTHTLPPVVLQTPLEPLKKKRIRCLIRSGITCPFGFHQTYHWIPTNLAGRDLPTHQCGPAHSLAWDSSIEPNAPNYSLTPALTSPHLPERLPKQIPSLPLTLCPARITSSPGQRLPFPLPLIIQPSYQTKPNRTGGSFVTSVSFRKRDRIRPYAVITQLVSSRDLRLRCGR